MHTLKSIAPGIFMIVISVILLSQAYVMEDQSLTDPASGSFFPALIALIMLITGIVTTFQGGRRQQRSSSHFISETSDGQTEGKENTSMTEQFSGEDYKLILLYFGLVVIFVILLPILSFFPAAFLFLVTSMFFLRGVSWVLNLLVSIGSIIVIYLLFSELFKIIFP